jgi:hypothetical protein
MYDYEILRITEDKTYYDVTQRVDAPRVSGPDAVVCQAHDPQPGERILVRYIRGGGITVYEVQSAVKFEQVV